MKTLLAIAASLFITNVATAALLSTAVPADTIASLPIEHTSFTTRPLCPVGVVCVTDGTVIDLEYDVHICVNSLGPVTYVAQMNGQYLDVYISAIEYVNKYAATVRCPASKIEKASIYLIGKFGEVRIIPLTNNANPIL